MLIVGLTGGVACGKTTVANFMAREGVPVIDTDEIARDLATNDATVRAEILASFGTLDRGELRKKAFASPEARKRLETILHPRIGRNVEARLSDLRGSARLAVLVVPLLFEVGWQERVDKILAVVCSEDEQIRRLLRREGVDEPLARSILASQLPNSEKAARADYVVETNGTPAESAKKIRAVLSKLRAAAQ